MGGQTQIGLDIHQAGSEEQVHEQELHILNS